MIRKKKFKHDFATKDIYKVYKKRVSKSLNYKQFSLVLNTFNEKLIKSIYNGAYIQLPYKLGDLYIHKYKPKLKFDENGEVVTLCKRGMVDYKATNELWREFPELAHIKRVYYDNFHTDRYKFKIVWKRYHTIRICKIYNFRPARAFSRGLAQYLKSNPNQNYYGK
jgi:nucleoid DNA-binding protein